MMEGMKVLISRIFVGFVSIIMMVVYHTIDNYARSTNPEYLEAALTAIEYNVNVIYFVILAGCGIACYHVYYRAVQRRKYESEYTESGWHDAYNS